MAKNVPRSLLGAAALFGLSLGFACVQTSAAFSQDGTRVVTAGQQAHAGEENWIARFRPGA